MLIRRRSKTGHWQDGVVTLAEYHMVVDRFITCARDAGYEVSEPVLSPIDGLRLLYSIAPSGEPRIYNDAVQSCNLSHISLTEPAFVESQSQVMNETLRQAVVTCLQDQGPQQRARNSMAPNLWP